MNIPRDKVILLDFKLLTLTLYFLSISCHKIKISGHHWIWPLLGAFVFHKYILCINERLQILYEVKSSGVGPGLKVF